MIVSPNVEEKKYLVQGRVLTELEEKIRLTISSSHFVSTLHLHIVIENVSNGTWQSKQPCHVEYYSIFT